MMSSMEPSAAVAGVTSVMLSLSTRASMYGSHCTGVQVVMTGGGSCWCAD